MKELMGMLILAAIIGGFVATLITGAVIGISALYGTQRRGLIDRQKLNSTTNRIFWVSFALAAGVRLVYALVSGR